MVMLAIPLAGALIGSAFGYAAIGWMIGTVIAQMMNRPDDINNEGAKLSDLRVTGSNYGVIIPHLWGTMRIGGNIIDASTIRETTHHESVGGGKGGGGPDTNNTTFSYSVDLDVYLCVGQISGLRRIWGDGKIIYDVSTVVGSTINAGATTVDTTSQRYFSDGLDFTLYYGTETQLPDPTFEAINGVGNVPGYRGVAHVVFNDMQLAPFGNRVPNFTFEVVKAGTLNDQTALISFSANVLTANTIIPPVAEGDGDFIYFASHAGSNHLYVVNRAGALISDNVGGADNNIFGAGLGSDGKVYTTGSGASSIKRWSNGIVDGTVTPSLGWGATLFGHLIAGSPQGGNLRGIYRNDDLGAPGVNNMRFFTYDPVLLGFQHLTKTTSDTSSSSPGRIAVNPDGNSVVYNIFSGPVLGDKFYVWPKLSEPFLITSSISPAPSYVASGEWSSADDLIYLVDEAAGHDPKIDIYNTAGAYQRSIEMDFTGASSKHIRLGQGSGGTIYCWAGVYVHTLVNGAIQTTHGPVLSAAADNTGLGISPDGYMYAVGSTTAEPAYVLQIQSILTDGSTMLSQILTEISAQVGLAASDINVVDVADINVHGFAVGSLSSARAAIEQLQRAFFFDVVDSAGQIKFIRRGHNYVATIGQEKLGAHREGETVNAPFIIDQLEDIELPKVVNVRFADTDRNYQDGAQSAKRQITRGVSEVTLELPIAMDNAKARAVAEVLLYNAWQERSHFSFRTGGEYYYLEPADVVRISNASASYTVRILRMMIDRNMLSFDAVMDDANVYSAAPLSSPSRAAQNTIKVQADATFIGLDVPLLDTINNEPGFYAALSTAELTWPGAQIYRKEDSGALLPIAAQTVQASAGVTQNKLGNFTQSCYLVDWINYVDVLLTAGSGALSSTTFDGLLGLTNYALVGQEIIQFTTASQGSGNVWTLTGLMRGRLGTEWAVALHTPADAFVLLNSTTVVSLQQAIAQQGLSKDYRAVTIGRSAAAAVDVPFTNNNVRLKPYSPAQLYAVRDAATDSWVATWHRRTRYNGGWNNNADVPLNEDTESYRVLWFGGAPFALSAVTKATDGVFSTTFAHSLAVGDYVMLYTVTDMVEINERVYAVTEVPSSTSFKVGLNTTNYATYVSGGQLLKVIRSATVSTETDSLAAGSPSLAAVGIAVAQISALRGLGYFASRYITQG